MNQQVKLPYTFFVKTARRDYTRPISAFFREFLQNSVDAGSKNIELKIYEKDGKTFFECNDDGCGMDPDDALLALERHATSKIASAADLEHIASLGFRGEALPAMAAVSRLILLTAADPAEGGVRITVEGGRILGVEPAARPRGTTVEVRDLFFNTPARRKFLRAPETELRHAQESVWGAALAHPEVAFTLQHGSRTLIDAAPTTDPGQRLRDLWERLEGPVHRFEEVAAGVEVWGLLGAGGGSGKPSLTLIVNGRPVRDRNAGHRGPRRCLSARHAASPGIRRTRRTPASRTRRTPGAQTTEPPPRRTARGYLPESRFPRLSQREITPEQDEA